PATPPRPPGLKYEVRPQGRAGRPSTVTQLSPRAYDGRGFQQSVPTKLVVGEQALGPLPKRSSQPSIDGHRESHLGAFHKVPRQSTIQHLTQRPFPQAPSHLEGVRQSPRELHHSVIQKRRANLEAHGHD